MATRAVLLCCLLLSLCEGALLGMRCQVARSTVAMAGGFAAKGKKNTKQPASRPSKKAPSDPQPSNAVSAAPAEPERYELPPGTQFMGGWMIQPQICDALVRVFEESPQAQTRGVISMRGGDAPVVDKNVKDSIEMSFAPNDPRPEWKEYLAALGGVVASYVKARP